MMTSSNGNIFRVSGHLCGEFTGPPVNPPHKGQWRGALMFSLICVWINGWVNSREAGNLRRYRAHFDVTEMHVTTIFTCIIRTSHHKSLRAKIGILRYCTLHGEVNARICVSSKVATWHVQFNWAVYEYPHRISLPWSKFGDSCTMLSILGTKYNKHPRVWYCRSPRTLADGMETLSALLAFLWRINRSS